MNRSRHAPTIEPPDLPEPSPEPPPCACSACLSLDAAMDAVVAARREVQVCAERVDRRHHLDPHARADDDDEGDDWRHVRVGPHVIALEPLRAALTDRGHPHGATPTRLRTAPPF